jgi:4-hydroxyphenylacetate decarboxylase small subunit
MTTKLNHRDCHNYAPIDVVKGMCHVTKTIKLGDEEQCGDFSLMPKCKHCTQFTADTETVEMGVCQASTMEPKFFAFPDMVSVTCEYYKQN